MHASPKRKHEVRASVKTIQSFNVAPDKRGNIGPYQSILHQCGFDTVADVTQADVSRQLESNPTGSAQEQSGKDSKAIARAKIDKYLVDNPEAS
jgi:hypothetical protein